MSTNNKAGPQTAEWWIKRIADPSIRDRILASEYYQYSKNKEFIELWQALNSTVGSSELEDIRQKYFGKSGTSAAHTNWIKEEANLLPVVQQGYKVGDWVYVLYDHSHGSKNKAGDVKQIVQEKKDCYLAGCCQLAYAVGDKSACYELPKNIRPATEKEIAQATQSTEGWKIGQVLPVKWLMDQYTHYEKADRQPLKWNVSWNTCDRKVEKVEDGWAKIGPATFQPWLPPKHLCTPLPTESKEWIPKVGEWVVVKDSGCCCGAGLNVKTSPTTAYQISESGVIGHYKWSYRLKNAPEGLNAIAGDGDPSKSIRAATPEEIRKAEGKPDKQYICTSEDGVKLYDKDEPFWVYNGNKGWVWKDKIALSSLHVMSTGSLTQTVKDGEPMWKVFSTESAAKAWIEQQNNRQIPVTKENARVGMKVVRGKDWDWGNQDGGEGSKGTITDIRQSGWVTVKWSETKPDSYRIGNEGKYDLYIAPGESSTNKSINSQTKTSQKQTSYEQANKQQQQDSTEITGRALLYGDAEESPFQRGIPRKGTPARCGEQLGAVNSRHKRNGKCLEYC